MRGRSGRRVRLGLVLGALSAVLAMAGEPEPGWEAWLDELESAVSVELKSGQVLSGSLEKVEPDAFVLRSMEAGGTVAWTLRVEEVSAIRFPGNRLMPLVEDLVEQAKRGEATQLFDRLFRQRGLLLRFCGPAELRFFVRHLWLYRESERTLEGLGRAEILLSLGMDGEMHREVERERLLGFCALGFHTEAEALAERWVRREAQDVRSALGHYVLARLELRKGEPEKALSTLMRAIVFFRTPEVPYLNRCYVLATRICKELGKEEAADRLDVERKEWGMRPDPDWNPFAEWPEREMNG